MHLHFIEKDLSSYSAWAMLPVPVALSSIQKYEQRHYEHCESEGPQSILMVSALGMEQHRHKCTRKKAKENMLVLGEDSHACQIILKCPGSSSVFLLLIRHFRPWLLVIPLRELWIISTAYESPGLSWQPQTNPGSWERYHSSAVQWRVGCGGCHCFFHGSYSIKDKNTLTAFSGLGYLAMWEGSPFDSSQMGQLPPLPAIWKWEVFNQQLINVANMYSVESIILFNLATPPAPPTFYEWGDCQTDMFLIQLLICHYL